VNSRFYERNSGSGLVEEILSGARRQAESFSQVLNEYSLYNMANKRLLELQSQLVEQSKVVGEIRKELEEVERLKKPKPERRAVQERFRVESGALDELRRCIIVLEGIEPPEMPDWLVSFMREVIAEYV